MEQQDYQKIASAIRLSILEMIYNSKSSHIGSAFSIVDLLVCLYFNVMSVNLDDRCAIERDLFILSKGHAATALYATLCQRGYFASKELEKYGESGTKLSGHVIKDCLPGIEVSAGSLGHGLPIAAGMALAAKLDNRRNQVFCLMGDGECNEGSVWEAAIFAGHHQLGNLFAIIDFNNQQGMGRSDEILNLSEMGQAWEGFGWEVQTVDGHNHLEIIKAFANFSTVKPKVLIAKTVKGKGVAWMEDKIEWHYKSPTEDQYQEAKNILTANL